MSAATDELARVRRLILHESPDPNVTSGSIAWLQCLCRAAVRALSVDGAGISVIINGQMPGMAAASDARSELVEELQFTLGEGPCQDSHSTGRPVLAPDLNAEGGSRWPAYAPSAVENGVAAVFAFPIRIGMARLGVLDIYRTRPGSLSADAFDLATTFATVALTGLLDAHEALRAQSSAGENIDLSGHRVEVYQAAGMVQVQLGIGGDEALIRLRAYAYAQGRRLGEVARDIVARRLTLEQDRR